MPNDCSNELIAKIPKDLDEMEMVEVRALLSEAQWARCCAGTPEGKDFGDLPCSEKTRRFKMEAKRQLNEFLVAAVSPPAGKDDTDPHARPFMQVFTFTHVAPIEPGEVPRDGAPGQMPDWWVKHNRTWGTKWDAYAARMEVTGSRVTINFCSAWAPPTGMLEKAAAAFPLVHFTLYYAEPGCGVYGTVEHLLGGVPDEETGECAFWDEDDLSDADLAELERRNDAACMLARPGTDFADWCTRTGRYEVYYPIKRSRHASPEPAVEVKTQ